MRIRRGLEEAVEIRPKEEKKYLGNLPANLKILFSLAQYKCRETRHHLVPNLIARKMREEIQETDPDYELMDFQQIIKVMTLKKKKEREKYKGQDTPKIYKN